MTQYGLKIQALVFCTERRDGDSEELHLQRKSYSALTSLIKHCDGEKLQEPLEALLQQIQAKLTAETSSTYAYIILIDLKNSISSSRFLLILALFSKTFINKTKTKTMSLYKSNNNI